MLIRISVLVPGAKQSAVVVTMLDCYLYLYSFDFVVSKWMLEVGEQAPRNSLGDC